MDNQPSIQSSEKPNNQNGALYITLGIIGAVIVALILCIVFLVPNVKKAQNIDLLQQADQLDDHGDGCSEIINILSNIDESVLNDETAIKYYRHLFVCYDALGNEQESEAYYLKLLDAMNKNGHTNGG